MAILLAQKDGTLVSTTDKAELGPALAIGKPIGVRLLTFFPGTIKKDWGGKAEIMISSNLRLGPSNQPAPRRVNLMLQGYDFKKAPPITDIGGDYYGDKMLHYSKAYAGQSLGLTMRGVETDKLSKATWKGMQKAVSKFGDLALFASAAPYLAALPIAMKVAKTLLTALNRNDKLQTSRVDLHFDEQDQKILQTGRYLLWNPGTGSSWSAMKSGFKLSSQDEPNVLVSKKDSVPFQAAPYFVLHVDAKKRKEYESFEIGAASAALLEEWGDKSMGATILDSIQTLAEQVNDAKQLGNVTDLLRDLKKAKTDEEKKAIKEKIKAHTELFTDANSDLLNDLLADSLK